VELQKIILYYGFAPVADPEAVKLWQKTLCESLGLKGRILISKHGINGTLAVDFNPNLSTTAQTFTAATGEVWTTNGNARIYGNTNATYGIPAQWDAGGPFGYLAEGARTQIIAATADIRDMTTANWTLGATMTRNRNQVGADGAANSATLLTGGAVAATNIITYLVRVITDYFEQVLRKSLIIN
jgi:hypothetical protein